MAHNRGMAYEEIRRLKLRGIIPPMASPAKTAVAGPLRQVMDGEKCVKLRVTEDGVLVRLISDGYTTTVLEDEIV